MGSQIIMMKLTLGISYFPNLGQGIDFEMAFRNTKRLYIYVTSTSPNRITRYGNDESTVFFIVLRGRQIYTSLFAFYSWNFSVN